MCGEPVPDGQGFIHTALGRVLHPQDCLVTFYTACVYDEAHHRFMELAQPLSWDVLDYRTSKPVKDDEPC